MKISLLRVLLLLAVLLSIPVFFFMGSIAYREFKVDRYEAHAANHEERGEWRAAMDWYAKSLEIKPENLETIKKMASYADFVDDPSEIIWWREWAIRDPKSENAKLGLANSHLKRGSLDDALEVMDSFQPNNENRSRYQRILTAIWVGKRDYEQAESNARKAILAEPESDDLKLNLLTILLRQGNPQKVSEVNTLLAELGQDDESAAKVWRTMLGFSLHKDDLQTAKRLSQRLIDSGRAELREKSRHVGFLIGGDNEELDSYLETLVDSEPLLIEQVTSILTRSGDPQRAITWLELFTSEDLLKSPSYEIAYADALAASKKWNELLEYLLDKNWDVFDYYRNALKARAHRANLRGIEFRKEWNEALGGARRYVQEQLRLAVLVESWPELKEDWERWVNEMLAAGIHPQWCYAKLQQIYYEREETWQLLRTAKEALDVMPDNDNVRNNLIMYSLLLNEQPSEQLKKAEALFEKYPGKMVPISTYAFALYKNGKTADAHRAMQTLDPRALEIPEIAHYARVYSLALGEDEVASALEPYASNAVLLPEEQALLEEVRG